MTSLERSEGTLPVFVFPSILKFYVADQNSHKQVLTLYNPYEFTVLFKVLCNNPSKYNVVEPEGLINSKCCVDIVVRVVDTHQVLCQREDKFRIHLYELGFPKLLGKKDIVALLREKCEDQINESKSPLGKDVDEFLRQHRKEPFTTQRSPPSVTVIVLILALILALMLPADQSITDVGWLRLFYLTLNHKLCLAFVLGLLTMAVLKP